jgi:hypothetical protein
MKLSIIFLAAVMALNARDKTTEAKTDPLLMIERAKLDAAVAQRNYLLAQAQMEKAEQGMQARIAAANSACAQIGQEFDAVTVSCRPKPAEKK